MPAGREIGERTAVISGVGQSADRPTHLPPSTRPDGRGRAPTPSRMPVSRATDIDGMATYPGDMDVPPGFSGVGITDVQDALRLELNWFIGRSRGARPARLGGQRDRWRSRRAGQPRAVLPHGLGGVGPGRPRPGLRDDGRRRRRELPRRRASCSGPCRSVRRRPRTGSAMMAQRHFHEYGTTREQLAQIALNGRRNAARNPNAIYRDPMTLDDYLGVRMISTPFCLYDCDVPADGSTAVIVSPADAAPDLRRPPVRSRSRRHRVTRPAVVGPVRRPHHDGRPRRGAP